MLFQIIKLGFTLLKLKLNKKVSNKVLLVAEYGKSGGTRTYLFYLMEFFHKQKANVTLLVNTGESDDEIALLIKKYNFKTLEINFDFWCIDLANVPEGLTRRKLINYQIKELLIWNKLLNEYRFTSLVFSVAYPEQYLYTFLLPVRIVYILHTVPEKELDRWKRWVLKTFIGKNKNIITVSNYAKQSIEQYWLVNSSCAFVQVAHNFYEPKYVTNKTFFKKKGKTILTIGTVIAYKNPYLFIEVAKKVIAENVIDDIQFIWAGEGPLLENCKVLTQSHSGINFIGLQENVEGLYEGADIYYQPSLMESHGIAVLGAMYHELPCVVSNQGGLQESVINGETGFVIKNILAESVSIINTLLNNVDLRNSMGNKGAHRLKHVFSKLEWEKKMKISLSFF